MKCLVCNKEMEQSSECGPVCEKCLQEGPTKCPEANEFIGKLRARMDELLDLIPPAKTGVCGCGKLMVAVNGTWWCEECKVWKVKDAREMIKHIYTPYIPLYVTDIICKEEEKK